jgi:hypothetical protein
VTQVHQNIPKTSIKTFYFEEELANTANLGHFFCSEAICSDP